MLEDTFGDIIGKARFGKGWSLSELARRSHCAHARLEALEEDGAPTEEEIKQVALPLDLDPNKLISIARSAWAPRPLENGWAENIRRIDGRIGDYPVNGYLLIDPIAKVGALFDTGYSPKKALQMIREEGVRLVALCVTHAHPDHIGGAEQIAAGADAPIYLHPNELSGKSRSKGIIFLKDGIDIFVGRFKVRPLSTPGHTPGGTTYLIEGDPPAAAVGDALFAGSLGRAQSAATYPLLLRSVRSEILSLPNETLLLPGHGPMTTVLEEKGHNPFFLNTFPTGEGLSQEG